MPLLQVQADPPGADRAGHGDAGLPGVLRSWDGHRVRRRPPWIGVAKKRLTLSEEGYRQDFDETSEKWRNYNCPYWLFEI